MRNNSRINLFFLVIFMVTLGLLLGCARGRETFFGKKRPQRSDLLNEYQARFSDIPFPFDGKIVLTEEEDQKVDTTTAQFQNDFVSHSQFTITCVTKLTLPELQALYHTEMEQLGWRERAFFEEKSEMMLGFTFIFEKPGNKLLVITVQLVLKKYHTIVRYYRA